MYHSDYILGGGTTSRSAREETSTQKCAFKRPVAMHASATETGDFASGIEAGYGLTIGLEDAAGEIRLYSSQGFARQDRESDRNQRSSSGVEETVRLGDTDQL